MEKANMVVEHVRQFGNRWKEVPLESLAKHAVFAAKKGAEKNRFKDVEVGKMDILRIAQQMKWEN